MSEVYTINDFITEYGSYQYSKDQYDILKESCELKLMNSWLESYNYMKEHEEVIEQYGTMFTECKDEQVALVEAAYNDKFAALVNRVLNGISKFIKKAIRILHIIGSKLKGQDKNLKEFKKIVISNELVGDIFTESKHFIKGDLFNRLTIMVKDLGIKFDDEVSADDKKLCQLIFYVAYSDDIKLEPFLPLKKPIKLGNNTYSKKPIFPENYIATLCEKAINSSTSDGAKAFRAELNSMIDKGTKDLSFYMKDDYNVKKTIENLNAIQKKCEDEKWEGFQEMEELNINLATVYQLAATTLEVFTTLVSVRVDLQSALSVVIKNKGGNENA